MMKKFFSALGAGICAIWNWIGHIIILLVKFLFWTWGGILVSILVAAVAFLLVSLSIKALDQTRFGTLIATEMGMDMTLEIQESLPVESVPEMDTQIEISEE